MNELQFNLRTDWNSTLQASAINGWFLCSCCSSLISLWCNRQSRLCVSLYFISDWHTFNWFLRFAVSRPWAWCPVSGRATLVCMHLLRVQSALHNHMHTAGNSQHGMQWKWGIINDFYKQNKNGLHLRVKFQKKKKKEKPPRDHQPRCTHTAASMCVQQDRRGLHMNVG